MSDIYARIRYAIERRPVRVVEALIGLAAALGLALAPEVEEAAVTIVVALVGIVGGEVAQTQTTSAKHSNLADADHVPGDPDPADG